MCFNGKYQIDKAFAENSWMESPKPKKTQNQMIGGPSCGWVYVLHPPDLVSGQIIATSHDLTPNGGLVREIPLFQGNLGW